MHRKKRWSVSKYTIIYSLILFLYFRPGDYVLGTFLYDMISYLLFGIFVLMIFYTGYMIYRKKIGFSFEILGLLISYFWFLCGSTLLNYIRGNPVNIKNGILNFSIIGGLILLTETGLQRHTRVFLYSFMLVGTITSLINAFTIFAYGYEGGMREITMEFGRYTSENYFFFAEDNATFFWTWPVMVITWIYYFRYNKRRKMLIWASFFSVITIISYIYMWSMMAMMAVISEGIILIIMYHGIKRYKTQKVITIMSGNRKIHVGSIFTFNKAVLSGIIASILLVFTRFLSRFTSLIEGTLQKSITLSGRTNIWERAIFRILVSPIIGYGNESVEMSTAKLGINHTHNFILEILYRGGIIGLLLFMITLFACGKKSLEAKKSILYSFFCVSLMIFFVSVSVEFAFYRHIYVVLLVMALHKQIFCDEKLLRI